MKYKFLKDEQQEQIRQQTITQVESEHYATELAIQRAHACGEDLAALQNRLGSLEAQHKALTA